MDEFGNNSQGDILTERRELGNTGLDALDVPVPEQYDGKYSLDEKEFVQNANKDSVDKVRDLIIIMQYFIASRGDKVYFEENQDETKYNHLGHAMEYIGTILFPTKTSDTENDSSTQGTEQTFQEKLDKMGKDVQELVDKIKEESNEARKLYKCINNANSTIEQANENLRGILGE
jgi:methyl-accepting chemotaxis protein